MKAEAGIATVLVRGGVKPGRVVVRAAAGALKSELALHAERAPAR